ncbi:MAG: LpxI family protein [Lentisphaerae bacterium]|nr:LpxI family protein [Lentisphaerota bacterium]
MTEMLPDALGLIAGRGVYPLLVAQGARKAGVRRIHAVAFRGETERAIAARADSVRWIHMGRLGGLLDALRETGARHAVMAGQLTPRHLFHTRLDGRTLALLKGLPARNAHTIFGAVAEELQAIGIALLPAHSFMADHMPAPGLLTRRAPTPREEGDIALGMAAVRVLSALDIGQTIVVKEGTVIAAEAFEGTDETIRRAGRLAGRGAVVVKGAKAGHDMRFDIPVAGLGTLRVMRRIGAGALAVEAHRTILLERERFVAEADRMGLAVLAADARRGAAE